MKKLLVIVVAILAMTQTVKSSLLVAGFRAFKSRASGTAKSKFPLRFIMQSSKEGKGNLAENKTLVFTRAQEAGRQLKIMEQSTTKLPEKAGFFDHAPTEKNCKNNFFTRWFASPAEAENFNHGKVFDEMVEEVLNNGKKDPTFRLTVFLDEKKKQKIAHKERAYYFPGEEFVYRPWFFVDQRPLEILLKENKEVFMSSLGPNKREQDFRKAFQRYANLNILYSLRAHQGPPNRAIDDEIKRHQEFNSIYVLLECFKLCFRSPSLLPEIINIWWSAKGYSDKFHEKVSWNNTYNFYMTYEELKNEVRLLCRDNVRYFVCLAVAMNKKHKNN